jgi:molybdopterin-guanine dinucleotide biosynthesis protein A
VSVLAGGKSQRFGEDKSQVKLGDKLLIDYILSEIIDEFNEVLVVSNNLIDFKQSEKISLIKDFKKDLGPLGGVLTAMKWVKDNNKDYQWISTFPVDTPFFKNEILKDFFKKNKYRRRANFFL